MMVMTCVKYFHENRYNPEIYEEVYEEDDEAFAIWENKIHIPKEFI